MLSLLYEWLKDGDAARWLNFARYPTFRIIAAGVASLAFGMMLGPTMTLGTFPPCEGAAEVCDRGWTESSGLTTGFPAWPPSSRFVAETCDRQAAPR